MFGLIRKKDLIKAALELYLEEDASHTVGETGDDRLQNFYYRCGNANALNYICYKFGIDLTKYVKEAKKRSNE